MAHISPDFKTKKAFKEAITTGKQIRIFSPGPFPPHQNGIEYVEAPAEYHRWYAKVQVENGIITKVLS